MNDNNQNDEPFRTMLPPEESEEGQEISRSEAKIAYTTFREAHEAWKIEQAASAPSDAAEPEYCTCGNLRMPLMESEMTPEVMYCDGLRRHILHAPKSRKMKLDSEEIVIETPNAPAAVYAADFCPTRSERIMKQHSAERAEVVLREDTYLTVDGKPMTLDNFRAQNPTQLATVQKIAAARADSKILLHGATGRGKTHLTRGLFVKLLLDGADCQWWAAAKLKDMIAKAQHWNRDSPDHAFAQQAIERLDDCQVLFIDDLGTEPKGDSDFFEDFLKDYFERRREGLIISTNLDEPSLRKRYPNDKLQSRFFMGLLQLTLPGVDYREKARSKA